MADKDKAVPFRSNTIYSFDGKYDFLSNFYPSPIYVEEFGTVPTVEHAYQASKTENSESIKEILNASSPGKAKRLGHKVKRRPNWEHIKLAVMLSLLKQKFPFDVTSDLTEQLLATGKADLQEGNTWNDTYWGVNIDNGQGKNWLGRLLMIVRSECELFLMQTY